MQAQFALNLFFKLCISTIVFRRKGHTNSSFRRLLLYRFPTSFFIFGSIKVNVYMRAKVGEKQPFFCNEKAAKHKDATRGCKEREKGKHRANDSVINEAMCVNGLTPYIQMCQMEKKLGITIGKFGEAK